MDAAITDESTALAVLDTARKQLNKAYKAHIEATKTLRKHVIRVRPLGLLTVDEMGEAVGRDRNFVDTIWSTAGETVAKKQTRFPVSPDANPDKARREYGVLAAAAAALKSAREDVTTARANRDRSIVMAYKSRVLGPSAIARAVGVDRNHVGRIARKHGVKPLHRSTVRNQYTSVDGTLACPMCGAKDFTEAALKRHIQSDHTNQTTEVTV